MINDKDEWGNIELPGLSDEELYTKNWTRVAAAYDRNNNKKWKERNAEINRSRSQSKERRAKHGTIMKQVVQTDEYRAKHQAAVDAGTKLNPEWRRKNREVCIKNQKRMMTPDGVFESRKAVAEHYKVIARTITTWLKTKPIEFYYLDK